MLLSPTLLLFIFAFLLSNPKAKFLYVSNYNILYSAMWLCIIWLIGIAFVLGVNYEGMVIFLETYASPDGDISDPKFEIFRVSIAPIFALSMLVFSLFTFRLFKISRTFLLIYCIFSGVHIIFFGLIINFSVSEGIPFEDNFLEWATFALSILASFIFLVRGILGSQLACLCCLAWFFFAMEEISWAQRLLSIDSPDYFLVHNYQQELNVHNFFNPIIHLLYLPLNLLLVCFLTWFRRVKLVSKLYNIGGASDFIRLSDKFGLWIVPTFLMFASFYPGQEFVEQQWALFGLVFSTILLLDFIKSSKLEKNYKI